MPGELRECGAQILHQGTIPHELPAFFLRAISVNRFAQALGIDVVFTPQPYGMPFGKVASVTVVHDLYRRTFPERFHFKYRAQWFLLFPLSLRRSDRVICVSEATRQDLLRLYPGTKDKAVVVHEAPGLPEPTQLRESPFPEPYILMVANFGAPTKNIKNFLEALRRLAEQDVFVRAVLVGTDPAGIISSYQTRLPALTLTHLPHVSTEQLVGLYRHARCYVNTSLAEGFCLPILEAQQFGTPVICSDLPVMHEVAGDGALFINPMDPSSLENAMSCLFKDDRMADELSQRASINARRFSWSRAAQETLLVFEKAMEKRTRHSMAF
jgi:glycosyltransferase involved in cell wall biosynthesis